MTDIRPYHTFLLLDVPNKIEEYLPVDSSPLLHHVLNYLNPLMTLQEIATSAQIQISELVSICDHFVKWGLGKYVSTITLGSHYRLKADFDLGMVTANSNLLLSYLETFHEDKKIDFLEVTLLPFHFCFVTHLIVFLIYDFLT